jgi:hypothetical protein
LDTVEVTDDEFFSCLTDLNTDIMLHIIYGLAYDTSLLGIAMMKKWYVVYQGRVPGVYDEWDDCLKQVNEFKGNNYKGHKSKAKAEASYMNHLLGNERKKGGERKKGEEGKKNQKKTIVVSMMLFVIAYLLYVILVQIMIYDLCMHMHVYCIETYALL